MNNLIVLILPKRLFEPTAIEATRLASKELENDNLRQKNRPAAAGPLLRFSVSKRWGKVNEKFAQSFTQLYTFL